MFISQNAPHYHRLSVQVQSVEEEEILNHLMNPSQHLPFMEKFWQFMDSDWLVIEVM